MHKTSGFNLIRTIRKNLISVKGFTLIELLIVVSIIGILVSIGLATFNSSQAKSRDAKRKADLHQIANAMELYNNDHGHYPAAGTGGVIDGCLPGGTSACTWGSSAFTDSKTVYMVKLPADPLTQYDYYYDTSPVGLNTSYSLCAHLEDSQDKDIIANPNYDQHGAGSATCNYGVSSLNATVFNAPVVAGPTSTAAPTAKPIPTSTPIVTTQPTTSPTPNSSDQIITKKVFLLIFNPIIESSNNRRLTDVLGWNSSDDLAASYINDVKTASHGIVNYQIAQRLEVDDFPILADGFDYNDASYLACWNDHTKCHDPWLVNYQAILTTYQICEKLNAGEIDELWTFGGPWFGFYESVMAGQGAFWTNGPVITGTSCNKGLHVMGFSYERTVAEMLEDLGHRTEGTMTHIFGEWNKSGNSDWDKFTRIDKTSPGAAVCGYVHYLPNSDRDYDWSNSKTVTSNCDGWLNYPNIVDSPKQINCSEWNCDARQAHLWWFTHLPHAAGTTNGKYNDWWKYVADTNNI